ncbi:MAG: nickel-dependent lactate racemase [Candidatus Caldatribacteriota bacterium]
MNKKVKIPYGPKELYFELPTDNIIIGSPKNVPSCNLEKEIILALNNPLGCNRFDQLIKKEKKIAIVIDDYTRPTPTKEILTIVLKKLKDLGVNKDSIFIIIATGIHRKMTTDELERKIGNEILNMFKVIQHNADNIENLTYLGNSSRNTPIWINKEVLKADIRIGIGLVEAHPYAGFCGGPKIIMPGIAGKKTIFSHHGHLAESINSWFGRTKGNPFWEDLVEIARVGGLNSVIDVVINGEGKVCDVFFGDPVKAQEEAIKSFIEIYGVRIEQPVDIVIASGNPKYWYFDQSNVAMLNASSVVKEGGTRIIAAYCSEGLGPDIIRKLYLESFSRTWPTPEQYLKEMKEGLYNYEMADAPAIYKLLQAEKKAHMILVTEGITNQDANKMRLDWTRNIQEAVNKVFSKYGNKASVLILPLGSMSYAYIKN